MSNGVRNCLIRVLRRFKAVGRCDCNPINRNILYTEGVQYVAENAGAHWLIDEIALIQPYDKKGCGLRACVKA